MKKKNTSLVRKSFRLISQKKHNVFLCVSYVVTVNCSIFRVSEVTVGADRLSSQNLLDSIFRSERSLFIWQEMP